MPRLQARSVESSAEVRTFPNGLVNVVQLGEVAVSRFLFQPGWRWSKDVGPIVGTRSCQHRHLGYTIAGSLQSELGCADDWQPPCASTGLVFDADDQVWQRAFEVPAGSWEYKAALNGTWDENYGLDATPNGANIPLSLAAPATVKFYYSHETHWVADSRTKVIAVAPGSFQSELGCPGDWDPGCLRSWLQDPDGDGVYTLTTTDLPAGSYETKVAINEAWDENYGQGGVPGGANIAFTVPAT